MLSPNECLCVLLKIDLKVSCLSVLFLTAVATKLLISKLGTKLPL